MKAEPYSKGELEELTSGIFRKDIEKRKLFSIDLLLELLDRFLATIDQRDEQNARLRKLLKVIKYTASNIGHDTMKSINKELNHVN